MTGWDEEAPATGGSRGIEASSSLEVAEQQITEAFAGTNETAGDDDDTGNIDGTGTGLD